MTEVATLKIEGTDELLAALNTHIGNMPDVVLDELGLWAEKILSESRKEAPWDTTHMIRTGTVEPYEENGQVGFQIGYNAKSFSSGISSGWYGAVKYAEEDGYNYAIRQHEDLTLYHPKPGAKAKFLEDPFHRTQPEIIPGIVRRIDSYYRQGIPSMGGMMASKRASLGNLGGRFI